MGTRAGAVLQSPMCCARVSVHDVPRPAGLVHYVPRPVPRLFPLLVRAERLAAPGPAHLCSATTHPGVSLEQAGQERGAAPELIQAGGSIAAVRP